MNKHLLLPALVVVGLVFCAPSSQPVPTPSPVMPAAPTAITALVRGKLIHLRPSEALSNAVASAQVTSVTEFSPAPTNIAVTPAQQMTPTVYASPYGIKQVGSQAVAADGTSYPNHEYKALAIPNDPSASQPWVAQANLSAAWDTPRGSSPTLLAIIDTGFALKHLEFAGRFYTNPGESGPTNSEAPSRLNCTDQHIPLDKSCNLIDNNGDGIISN